LETSYPDNRRADIITRLSSCTCRQRLGGEGKNVHSRDMLPESMSWHHSSKFFVDETVIATIIKTRLVVGMNKLFRPPLPQFPPL